MARLLDFGAACPFFAFQAFLASDFTHPQVTR